MRDCKIEHQNCKAGKCKKNKLRVTCVVKVISKIKYIKAFSTPTFLVLQFPVSHFQSAKTYP